MEDQYGNLATSGSAITVTLKSTSTAGLFSGSVTGTPTMSTVMIPKGSSSITAYYGDNTVGMPTITATAIPSGLTATTQIENIVVKPTQLVFSTGTSPGTALSATNIGPITVTEEGASGAPAVVAETVTLSSTSGHGSSPVPPDRAPHHSHLPSRPIDRDLLSATPPLAPQPSRGRHPTDLGHGPVDHHARSHERFHHGAL